MKKLVVRKKTLIIIAIIMAILSECMYQIGYIEISQLFTLLVALSILIMIIY